jgi:hypothetical protein
MPLAIYKLLIMSIKASTSYIYCDDPRRRSFYKWLDKFLSFFKLRYTPAECSRQVLDRFVPFGGNISENRKNDQSKLWLAMYQEAGHLIRHDDLLNWNKFNNLIVLNGAILTGFGASQQFGVIALLYILPIFGVILSWLFDFTLQEGMRCLRAHREKIRSLERVILSDQDSDRQFLFADNAFNHRDALELTPLLFTLFWIGTLVFVSSGLIVPKLQ